MTQYIVIDKDKKAFIEEFFSCMGITFEDLCSIKNFNELLKENEDLKTRLTLCEDALVNANKAIIALSNNVTDINVQLTNMLEEEMSSE